MKTTKPITQDHPRRGIPLVPRSKKIGPPLEYREGRKEAPATQQSDARRKQGEMSRGQPLMTSSPSGQCPLESGCRRGLPSYLRLLRILLATARPPERTYKHTYFLFPYPSGATQKMEQKFRARVHWLNAANAQNAVTAILFRTTLSVEKYFLRSYRLSASGHKYDCTSVLASTHCS